MTDQTTPAGEAPPQQERLSPEELKIRSEHKQQLARLEHEHELELMKADREAMRKMPLPLRLLFDTRLRDIVHQAATDMANAGAFCPKHLQGNPAACAVVVVKSITWRLDPYSVAAATYPTPDGKVAFEGKLYRAIAEASGELAGPIRSEYYGDWNQLPRPSFKVVTKHRQNGNEYQVPEANWLYYGEVEKGLGVKISATLRTGEEVSLDFDLIEAYPRNATTWPTRPKQQILQAAMRAFVNNVRPSLIMGVPFREDLDEAELPEMREVNPRPQAEPIKTDEEREEERKVYAAPQPVDLREVIKSEEPDGPISGVRPIVNRGSTPITIDPETGEVTEGPAAAAAEPQQKPAAGRREPVLVMGKSYINRGPALKELAAAIETASLNELLEHERDLRRTLAVMIEEGRDVAALEGALERRLMEARAMPRQSVPDEPELDEAQDEHLRTIAQEEGQQPQRQQAQAATAAEQLQRYENWLDGVRKQGAGAPTLGHVKSYRAGRLVEAAAYGDVAVADVNEIFDQAEVRITAAQRRAGQMG